MKLRDMFKYDTKAKAVVRRERVADMRVGRLYCKATRLMLKGKLKQEDMQAWVDGRKKRMGLV